MVSSRDFKILWATNQDEKLDALYRDNKLALLYFKLFQKKSYWKILGIRLDSLLRKHGFLTQDEQSELKTLYKSDLLYKFLRLNAYVCSNDLFPVTEAMRKSREAYRIITSRQKDFPITRLLEENIDTSIAVVGNAPIEEGNRNLRQKENIDASDIIVRFNKFQINSYEEHIGTKCSWLAMICNNYTGEEFPTILTDNPLFDSTAQRVLHPSARCRGTCRSIAGSSLERGASDLRLAQASRKLQTFRLLLFQRKKRLGQLRTLLREEKAFGAIPLGPKRESIPA